MPIFRIELLRILLAAALLGGIVGEARGQEDGVDAAIVPGDDFFAYANGAWLKATEIPAGKPRWDARAEINEAARQRVAALLIEAASEPAGSTARKVADFRAAWLNEAAIEARGLQPLKPMLDRIDGVRDKAALTRLLGSGLRADVDPLNAGTYDSAHLLGLAVQGSIHGEKQHVAFLLQGGLGLPDREHYLSAEPPLQVQRAQYEARIGRLLALAGFDHPEQRARAVMALETAIARSHATREASSNDRNADQVWTRADFARQAPGMDWAAFFAAAGLGRQPTFVAWQPSAIKGVSALVASQPLPVWKDYLRVRLIATHADVLPRAFADPSLPGTREQRALAATQSAMGDALGRMYVERYFPAEHKARVQAIAADVIAAFKQRVEAVTWMAPDTKAMALAKLRSVRFEVGYPDEWFPFALSLSKGREAFERGFDKLSPNGNVVAVDAADAIGNLRRIAELKYREALARLGQPLGNATWAIAPQQPGAILLFHLNTYNFAAALLQPPKFDPSAPDATNYGAIGAIIGHELSHFVDTLGAEYEADGRMRRWWTLDDTTRYEAATEPLVAQFASYQPFPDLPVNGQLTLTENLADLAGLRAAFAAHRRKLGNQANDADELRRQDRQFFIGFARAWRSKSRDEATRVQLATDGHAPERYRIATVRNLDAWYEAFDVRPGQRLYLEPAKRVHAW